MITMGRLIRLDIQNADQEAASQGCFTTSLLAGSRGADHYHITAEATRD